MTQDLTHMRVEYTYTGLHEDDVHADPFTQFGRWFQTAVDAQLDLPNAMVLATADRDGRPSARYVLLKEFDRDGFVFYTHADSPKGRQLQENPRAALVFYWHPMHRQVRIEGTVEMLDADKADDYFQSRPRGSQVSARVAIQSSRLESREHLHRRASDVEREFDGAPVPRPDNWHGYRVRPEVMEFWQGQENRLHDRLEYRRRGDAWTITRLAP
jgi:pyridoxamine 5'-phosphate oxidase